MNVTLAAIASHGLRGADAASSSVIDMDYSTLDAVRFSGAGELVLTILIPFVAAVVGWLTNVLALWMTFYPIEYTGWKPCGYKLPGVCSWWGIIPSKAKKMAKKSSDIITSRLVGVKEIFSRLDAADFAERTRADLRPMILETVDQVLELLMSTSVAAVVGSHVKEEIAEQALEESPGIVAAILTEMKENIEEIFSTEETVMRVLDRRKALIVDMFQECGAKEFDFIRISGFWFGGLFGLVQMVVWIFYREWWILPVFGLLVGWATNFLALKIIFTPIDPMTCCGRDHCCGYRIQGLFLQRQTEVASVYARLVATDILTADNIIEDLEHGDGGFVLYDIVKRHTAQVVDQHTTGLAGVLAHLVVGHETLVKVKRIVARMTMRAIPNMMKLQEKHMLEVFGIEETLRTRMSALPAREFEDVLHPVFEEDEWKLIALGAVLGALVGLAQAGIQAAVTG